MQAQLVIATDEFLSLIAKQTTFGKVTDEYINKFQYDETFRKKEVKQMYFIAEAHQTLLEFIMIGVVFHDVSRNAMDDLFRHRHASVNMQSTRNLSVPLEGNILSGYYSEFMELKDNWINEITKEPVKEQDRDKINGLIPLGVSTQGIMFMNLRELIHVYGLRSCSRARQEIQILLAQLKEQLKGQGFKYVDLLQPRCEHIGYCPEMDKDCCGRHITKYEASELLERFRIAKQETFQG